MRNASLIAPSVVASLADFLEFYRSKDFDDSKMQMYAASERSLYDATTRKARHAGIEPFDLGDDALMTLAEKEIERRRFARKATIEKFKQRAKEEREDQEFA
jgi:hypothetical protein